VKLSIRAKVLATYAALAVLVLAILATGLARLTRIGSRLAVIQSGYLPVVKTVNSAQSFPHLTDGFDLAKIRANRESRLFVESTTVAAPQLFRNQLRQVLEDARRTLAEHLAPSETRQLARIGELAEELIREHDAYAARIREALKAPEGGRAAVRLDEELQAQKRVVRARLDFVSRQLDARIRNAIHATVVEERRAVFWTIGLSVAALLLAALIGVVALVTLRPLRKLKEAAGRIAAGDLTRRVEIESDDEVGEVAREFNRMADSILERDEALRRQQERLIQSEKMAVVGRMAAKISHEVRNPLNALGLNIEMLGDTVADREARKSLAAMSAAIDRLNAVAESYLSMARTGTARPEATDLRGLLGNLEALIRPECQRRGLTLEMAVEEGLPTLRADPTRLEQAILNLLKNAMEATAQGGRLGVRAARENGGIALTVWDEGSGIPKETLPHVFEPFFTTKAKGTGLGLAITHEIVREQGGTVDCESEPGRGTRFRLHLPTA
jgi:signal transduction histidine kinase